jgi:hypothetical protein
MLDTAIAILELIIVLCALKIVLNMKQSRGMYVSDPSIGAAIGNASNRMFENSQAMLEPLSPVVYLHPNIGTAVGAPEELYNVYSGGGTVRV